MTPDQQFPYQPIAVVQSDTTVYDPPIRSIIISAPGDLVVRNEKGDLVTLVCPVGNDGTTDVGGSYPFEFRCGRVRQIMATNTTIANADLVALR